MTSNNMSLSAVKHYSELQSADKVNPIMFTVHRKHCWVAGLELQGISSTGNSEREAINNLTRYYKSLSERTVMSDETPVQDFTPEVVQPEVPQAPEATPVVAPEMPVEAPIEVAPEVPASN